MSPGTRPYTATSDFHRRFQERKSDFWVLNLVAMADFWVFFTNHIQFLATTWIVDWFIDDLAMAFSISKKVHGLMVEKFLQPPLHCCEPRRIA